VAASNPNPIHTTLTDAILPSRFIPCESSVTNSTSKEL
jgi:hypothetical protein